MYTKEYSEKLAARRAARIEKEPKPNESELLEQIAIAKKNAMRSCGFNENGKGFLYTGDTYKAKEDIKRIGGKWCSYANGWIAPVRLSLSGVSVVKVAASDVCNMYGYVDPELMWDFKERN